ncbi:MAG: TonB-dependent receptor [Chitinispirillia bacterium]|jgi:hypothetical protein
MKITNFFFVLFIAAFSLLADDRVITTGNAFGKVINVRNEIPIANAIVKILGEDVIDTTDTAGVFAINNIIPGLYSFEISADQYETSYQPSIQVKTGNNKELIFHLQKRFTKELDKLEVTSSKIEIKKTEQSTSVIKLTRHEIKNSPGAFEDVNEVLKILPSAIGTGDDWDNSLLVRGGSDNENIYLVDGMEVTNISHWGSEAGIGGAISSFHPDFIEHVEFYSGGFPVYTPPRLSSVTDMVLREGSYSDHSFQIDMNMAGVGLFLEGPVIPEKLSFILNGRVSFLDLIQKMINTGGLPKYQNGQLKLTYKINERNKIYSSILGMHDEIEETSENGDDEDEEYNSIYVYKEDNQRLVGSIGWDFISEKLKNKLVFSGSYSKGEDFGYNGLEEILTDEFKDTRKKYQIKNSSSLYLRENDVLMFGADFLFQDYNEKESNELFYYYIDTAGDNQISRNYPALTQVFHNDTSYIDRNSAENLDTTLTGMRIGGFTNYSLSINNITLNAGFRGDHYAIIEETGISPRISANLKLNQIGTFAVSYGMHYQFPTYMRIIEMKGYLNKIKLQRNWQVALGYEKQINKNIISGTEVYYKHYDREPFYEIRDQQRVAIITFDKFGTKRAYGIELYLQKKKKDKFYYNISYTLLNSELQYKDKKWHIDDYNLRNNATIVLGSQFHRFHGVCLRFDLSEGYPYTPIDMTNSGIETKYIVTDGWNTKRRKFRAKIGFRYNLTWYLKRSNVTLYAEVKNILNQRDIVYSYYDPSQSKIVYFNGMGILPVGGLTIDF